MASVKKKRRTQAWAKYEDAVRAILNQQKDMFGLEAVESKSGTLDGVSGGRWNIEIIAYSYSGGLKRAIFEVRDRKKNVTQEEALGFAGRIGETKSHRGFFVTPLGRSLQKGAKLIAKRYGVEHIRVSLDASPTDYILRFLNTFFLRTVDDPSKIIAGISDKLRIFVKTDSGIEKEVTIEEVNKMKQ